MKTLPVRLSPGQDLRAALEAAVQSEGGRAAFVIAGIGSLSEARLRFAGVDEVETFTGDTEILSLSGTVGVDDGGRSHSHLQMSVSTATGAVFGGIITIANFNRPDDYFERLPDRYAKMTTSDIDAAGRAKIDVSKLTFVIVGDASVVKPQLDQLKLPVEVVPAPAMGK